jgi:hypothetical protein
MFQYKRFTRFDLKTSEQSGEEFIDPKYLPKMKILWFASLFLFLVACCMPTVMFKSNTGEIDVMLGLRALAVGWSGIFAGVIAWYANPFWLVGLVLTWLRKPVPGLLLGLVAIVIAYSTFALVGRELPGDESNVTHNTVVKLLPGCYVWMASLILLPIAALFQKIF